MYRNVIQMVELGVIKKNFFWFNCTFWLTVNFFFFTSVIKVTLINKGTRNIYSIRLRRQKDENGIYHVVKTMLFKKRKRNSAHWKRQYPELAQVRFEARMLVRVSLSTLTESCTAITIKMLNVHNFWPSKSTSRNHPKEIFAHEHKDCVHGPSIQNGGQTKLDTTRLFSVGAV